MENKETILMHSQLSDCRRIFIRNYELSAYIGVYENEKEQKQRVRINIDVFILLDYSTPTNDVLEEVFDYDLIKNAIKARVEKGHIQLQETLCDDVANDLLTHPEVKAIRISSEKMDAYSDCESVGVEVFKIKNGQCNASF